ncbi:hypothetical protein [Kaistia adipata]|uniref:hypothetical protein n=1 Tax=Kaistia adipata TaxID=166954 RepID=UPI00316ADA77
MQHGFDRYGILYFVYRICAAFAHTTYAVAASPIAQSEIKISGDLVKIMPPSQMIWRIRLWQYIIKLSRRWNAARMSEDIVIFDQGFVQAIVSLAIFNGAADDALLSAALDLAPQADFAIRLLAPRDLIETRLLTRMQYESKAERLLEVEVSTNMASFGIFDDVNRVIENKKRTIFPIQPVDHETTQECLQMIKKMISEILDGSKTKRSKDPELGPGGMDASTLLDGSSR